MDVGFRALMERSSDAVLVADAETGRLVDCNAAALRLLGATRERLIGIHHTEIYPTEHREEHAEAFNRVASGQEGLVMGGLLLDAQGESVPVEASGCVIEVNGRRLVLGIFRDTTDQRLAEDELRRLNRALTAINACDEAIMQESDESELQARVTRLLVETGVGALAALICFHKDGPEIVAQAGTQGRTLLDADLPFVSRVLAWPHKNANHTSTAAILRKDGPEAAPRLSWMDKNAPESCFLISLPMDCEGGGSGALLLASCAPFDVRERDTLERLVDHLRNGIQAIRARKERDAALKAIRYRLGFEAILSSTLRDFFTAKGDSIEDLAQEAWGRLSAFLEIENSFCVVFAKNGLPERRFEWHAAPEQSGEDSVYDAIMTGSSSWFRNELQQGRTVALCKSADSFAGPQAELQRCNALGIQCMLLIPIEDDGQLAAVQGFYGAEICRCWAQEDVDMLKAAGRVLLGALRRADSARLLQESEDRLRKVLEAASNGVMDADFTTGRVVFGESWARMLGYKPHEIPSTIEACVALIHPEDIASVQHAFEEHASGKRPQYQAEFRLRNRDNEWQWVMSRGKIVEWDMQCRPKRFLGIHTDISERKRFESALEWRDTRHRALLQAIPDVLLRIRSDGAVLDVHVPDESPLAELSRTTLGQRLFDVFPEIVAEHAMHHMRRALDQKETQVFEFTMELAGQEGAFEARTVPTDEHEVILIIRDVSERNRLEREILEVSERERGRIGQDLHDGLGQQLVGISFLVNALATELKRQDSPLAENTQSIAEFVAEATTQSRSLARGLHITGLEEDGLAVALEDLTNRTRSVYDVNCKLVSRGTIKLPGEAANQMYRIAQEAVTNAVRHAEPSAVTVTLYQNDHRVRLAIEDDGHGFEPHGQAPGGIGLHIMRYRARVISASLEIDSEPGHGTRVVCSLPLTRNL